ncbi:MAG: hypothetical protein ABFC96_18590, partial [Thermoguttaceae bacterium]
GYLVLTRPPRVTAYWSCVEIGMSEADVRNLLGEPPVMAAPWTLTTDKTAAAASSQSAATRRWEYWEYDPEATLLWRVTHLDDAFFGPLFGPSDRSFVVFFDDDGKVKRLRVPLTGPYAKPSEDE